MKKTPLFFLEHIIESSNKIKSYVQNITKEDFVNDDMRYNATIRLITVIGEAVAQLETNFKKAYPDIPWEQIKAMRNRLIHEYWQTDLEQVYISATKDVPRLEKLVLPILSDLESQDPQS